MMSASFPPLPPLPDFSGPPDEIRDPATGEAFAEVRSATAMEAAQVIDWVAASWRTWAAESWEYRAGVLRVGAQRIRDAEKEIAALLTSEQGKPLKEAAIEVRRCADSFDLYASAAFRPVVAHRDVPGKRAFVVHEPVGVIGAVVPWNFPLTLMANKVAPALAAGNGVVVKPAPTTPFATARVVTELHAAGVPEHVLQLALGGADPGRVLVTHPAVRAVSFTGSTATGKQIMRLAADGIRRLTLELGGSDPMIVCADAHIEGAARAAAVGRFFNCGQACIAVKRVYIMNSVFDAFMEALLGRVDNLKIGDGKDPGVRVGPQHTEEQLCSTLQMAEEAVSNGAMLLRGGRRAGGPLANGYFAELTVLADPPDEARVAAEECFGPVLPVFRVESLDEACKRAGATRFGLGSSIWTTNPANVNTALREIEAGLTWVNDIPTDYDMVPFGGVKESGFGKERGHEGLYEYMNARSVVIGDAEMAWGPSDGS